MAEPWTIEKVKDWLKRRDWLPDIQLCGACYEKQEIIDFLIAEADKWEKAERFRYDFDGWHWSLIKDVDGEYIRVPGQENNNSTVRYPDIR